MVVTWLKDWGLGRVLGFRVRYLPYLASPHEAVQLLQGGGAGEVAQPVFL
jgi:hypothetical protein